MLPDVQVLPAALRDSVLLPWVEAGGVLVISGRTGRYQSRAAMYEPWATGAGAPPVGTEPLTGIADLDSVGVITEVQRGSGTVVVVPGRPAADAWLGRGYDDIDAVLSYLDTQSHVPNRIVSPPAGPEVQVRLHEDRWRGRLFVDLVNRNWDQATEQLLAAGPQELTVSLPAWLHDLPLEVRTAAERRTATAEVTSQGDAVTIAVDGVDDIVTVILESTIP